jgi:hypothetical protein
MGKLSAHRGTRIKSPFTSGGREGQRKVLSGVGISIVVTVGLLANSSGPRSVDQTPVRNNRLVNDQRALIIDHPTSILAGTPTNIVVRQTGTTKQVSLVVLGSAGSVTTQAIPVNGKAEFSLTSDATRLAGTVSLFARADDRVRSASMVIKPGPMSNIVDPIVGPRSIITDGIDLTMAVAFPMDVLGNVGENGTTVDFTFDHPDGTKTRETSSVDGLVAWREFNAHFQAGNAQASSSSSGQFGRSYTLRETPSTPDAFTLSGPKLLPVADGFTLVQVSTSPLRDVHGNLFDDGTAVIFTWDGPGGRSRQTAKTLDGVAQLVLEAPSSPSTVTFSGWALGATSSPLELKFQPATANIAIRLERSDRLLTARIGPVIGDHDAYVKDGTDAKVTITGSEGGKITRSVELVAASAIVREPMTSLRGIIEVRVSVLGYDRFVRLLPSESVVDTGGVGRNDKVVEAARTDTLRETATDTTVPTIPVTGIVDARTNG